VSIVQLFKPPPCQDIVESLRSIADEIEAGNHGDWPVTSCVVVLGHTDNEIEDDGVRYQASYWHTYGLGPRADSFTLRGLLATVIQRWGHDFA
jgi:hypothetical protein